MELLLIRHSLTRGNLLKQYIGSTDQPLAPEGIALAQKAACGMPPVDAVWCSPMLRCLQTAQILFPGQDPRIIPDLRECNFGDFEEKTWAQLKDNPIYRRWIDGEEGVVPPNGEDRAAFQRRGQSAVLQVIREAGPVGRAAVVTHGGVIMAAMEAYARPKKGLYDWQVSNCGGFLVNVEETPVFRVLKKL